ncbi:MAG TPA: hypothetical protein VL403_02245 [Candidatus Kryptonia bacterium]|nr:hypothetical protein [Candidatus Kryptonia bacterium]
MKLARIVVVAAALAGCEQSPPSQPSPPAPHVAAAQPSRQAPIAAPSPAVALEPLPRDVGGVSLGITFAEAGGKLGKLECHDNPQGFRVCTPTAAPAGSPSKLEVYLVHDRVVSLAYERDIGPNVWDFLNGMIARYGSPSLNGANEHDKQGRTHEIYGWKDDKSIYSVRFIWQGEEGARQLSTTAIALWDREVFQQWEEERRREQRQPEPPPPAEPAPGEST